MSDLKVPALPPSRSGKDALSIATQAAREAGAILRSHFFQEKQVESKGNRNLVTNADLLAEQSIIKIINAEYPDHGILCEESGHTAASSEYCWVVDPLDGTTNYAFGIPFFAVSLGLTCEDEVVLGLVYDPLRDELFRAVKGQGAFLNESPIAVAGKRNFRTTVIGFDLGYDDIKTREMLSKINSVWSAQVAMRLMGSAALGLTYVACGRMNVYIHASIYPWDVAGAILLLREAGGSVTDWEGTPATIWDTSLVAFDDISEHRALYVALEKSNCR